MNKEVIFDLHTGIIFYIILMVVKNNQGKMSMGWPEFVSNHNKE